MFFMVHLSLEEKKKKKKKERKKRATEAEGFQMLQNKQQLSFFSVFSPVNNWRK